MHNRYYSPRLGHFLTPDYRAPNIYDPSTFTQPYAYAAGNPITYLDADGLEAGWTRSAYAGNPAFRAENQPTYQVGAQLASTPQGQVFVGAMDGGVEFTSDLFYGAALYFQAGLYEVTGLEIYKEGYEKSEAFMHSLFAFLKSDGKLNAIVESYKTRLSIIDSLILSGEYEEAGAETQRLFLELYFIIRAAQGASQVTYNVGKAVPQLSRSLINRVGPSAKYAPVLGPRINLIDPRPGGLNPLSPNPLHWYKAAPSTYSTKPMLEKYIGEELGLVFREGKVIYLTPDELARFEVFYKGGRLFDAQGKLIDTTSSVDGLGIYVMNRSGQVFLSTSPRFAAFHHSSFLAGGEVSAAGEITVKNGLILGINRASGHYQPNVRFFDQILTELKRNKIDVP